MAKKRIIYSEEIQDIMGTIPGWIVRWGILLIAVLCMIILALSCYVRYPEIITAPIVLTTINPPADLIARSSGKVEEFFASEGKSVSEGDIIAVLFNTADYVSVLKLEHELESRGEAWNEYLCDGFIGQDCEFGELQVYYIQFLKLCKTYHHYLKTDQVGRKREMIRKQIEKSLKNHRNQSRQLSLLIRDAEFERKNLVRDSMLIRSKAITEYDFEKTQQAALQKEMSLVGQESALSSTEANIISLEDQLLELSIREDNDTTDYRIQLSESREQLMAQIRLWRDRYLLVSPINGRIALTRYWSKNQNVVTGERLVTVVPNDTLQVVGKMYIPSAGLAKVEVGQTVNVKLNGFPYMEFGILKGKLVSLSSIPEADGYAAEVEFPRGLVSSYKTRLAFIQQMDGTGDIITRDTRLIERFLRPIKSIVTNNLKGEAGALADESHSQSN